MKSINYALSLAIQLFYSSMTIAAVPESNPPMSEILAKIQQAAAEKVKPTPSPAEQSPATTSLSAHIRSPSAEERMHILMEKQGAAPTPSASQPIPPFLMRAESRPLESGGLPKNGSPIKNLKGCIKIDHSSDDVPQFKIYFEGMETTSNDEGFYSFPIDVTRIEKFGIIICNKIKHSFGRHNTIESFGLIPDMNYKYYKFSHGSERGGETWIRQESDLRQKNFRIPRNTIVIPLNPAYFDRLETAWPGNFDSSTLKLPRIVLKAGCEKKINRKAMKSLLYGLDMSPFHTSVKHAVKEVGDGKADLSLDRAM